jgi:hypothetical protein
MDQTDVDQTDDAEYGLTKRPYKVIPMPEKLAEKLRNDDTKFMAKPNAPEQGSTEASCSKCRGQRIVRGSIVDSHRTRCFFAPAGLKFWTITKSYGTKVDSYACIDCGLVWMRTEHKMLEGFVRNYCDQKID